MERDQVDSYEIYKQHPEEAFTLYEDAPSSVDEEIYNTLRKRSKESIQVTIKNDLNATLNANYRNKKGKNKGRKKKTRGRLYSMNNRNTDGYARYDKEETTLLLRKVFGPAIERETTSCIYIRCPYHREKTASCCISKTIGIVKCFGCGKSHTLATFLSMTQGETKKYWQDQLDPPPPSNPNQLKIEFPSEEKTPG